MPDSTIDQITNLEQSAQKVVDTDNKTAAANTATPAKTRPRQVMKVRHLPREQRRFSVQYADASVPRVQREIRRQPMDYSRAYLKQPIELSSDRAQRLFESTYERTDQTLVVATLVIEAIGRPELVDQTNDMLHNLFDEMQKELMQCLETLKQGMTKKRIPEELQVAAYDHKRKYEAPIHTPFSSRFISVITLYDRVVARTEAAWVNRLIDSASKREMLSNWDQAVRSFITKLGRIRTHAIQQAKDTGHRQDALEIEQRVKATSSPIVEKSAEESSQADSKTKIGSESAGTNAEPEATATTSDKVDE